MPGEDGSGMVYPCSLNHSKSFARLADLSNPVFWNSASELKTTKESLNFTQKIHILVVTLPQKNQKRKQRHPVTISPKGGMIYRNNTIPS